MILWLIPGQDIATNPSVGLMWWISAMLAE